jgi:hypothetical protein
MKPFRRDAIFEQILRMKAQQPAEYARLQDKTKAAATIYERQKREVTSEASKETCADGDTAPWAA